MGEPQRTVIVGCGKSESVADVLAFGFLLAERPGWQLLLAHAYGSAAAAREDAELFLRGALRALPYGQPAGTRALASEFPATALSELAHDERAHVLVVGARGSVAEQLASTAGCPVAVAPRGFGALGTAA